MQGFLEAVYQFSFMQNALLTGVLAGISCGMVGSYVVVKRITYLVGGIAHSVLGGMGAARYFQVVHGVEWLTPMFGAVVAALAAAIIIGLVSLKARQREDTVISAIWAVGMATGVLFISRTPGYSEDLMNYLFGNILMVSRGDLTIIVALDIVVVFVCLFFYRPLLAICFDEKFARLRNINVEFYYILLLIVTALTVVLLTTVVGIIMVIALIALPAAVSGRFTNSLISMMILSIILAIIFTISGLWLSFTPDLPAGATIIVVSGVVYLLVACFRRPKIRFLKKSHN